MHFSLGGGRKEAERGDDHCGGEETGWFHGDLLSGVVVS